MGTTESVFYDDGDVSPPPSPQLPPQHGVRNAAPATSSHEPPARAQHQEQQVGRENYNRLMEDLVGDVHGERHVQRQQQHVPLPSSPTPPPPPQTQQSHSGQQHLQNAPNHPSRRRRRPLTASGMSSSSTAPSRPIIRLHGWLGGLSQSGKHCLLMRLQGRDPFSIDKETAVRSSRNGTSNNESNSTGTNGVTVPYLPPVGSQTWGDRIQVHIETMKAEDFRKAAIDDSGQSGTDDDGDGDDDNGNIDDNDPTGRRSRKPRQQSPRPTVPDFLVVLINPLEPDIQSTHRHIYEAVVHYLRQLGFNDDDDDEENETEKKPSKKNKRQKKKERSRSKDSNVDGAHPSTKQFCVCLGWNFRDLLAGLDEQQTFIFNQQKSVFTQLVKTTLKTFKVPSRQSTIVGIETSMKNCYGLDKLHRFIYGSYLHRKKFDTEMLLQAVDNQIDTYTQDDVKQHESNAMSYENFVAVITSETDATSDLQTRNDHDRKSNTKDESSKEAYRRVMSNGVDRKKDRRQQQQQQEQSQKKVSSIRAGKDALEAFLASSSDEEEQTSRRPQKNSPGPKSVIKKNGKLHVDTESSNDDDDDDEDDFFYDEHGQQQFHQILSSEGNGPVGSGNGEEHSVSSSSTSSGDSGANRKRGDQLDPSSESQSRRTQHGERSREDSAPINSSPDSPAVSKNENEEEESFDGGNGEISTETAASHSPAQKMSEGEDRGRNENRDTDSCARPNEIQEHENPSNEPLHEEEVADGNDDGSGSHSDASVELSHQDSDTNDPKSTGDEIHAVTSDKAEAPKLAHGSPAEVRGKVAINGTKDENNIVEDTVEVDESSGNDDREPLGESKDDNQDGEDCSPNSDEPDHKVNDNDDVSIDHPKDDFGTSTSKETPGTRADNTQTDVGASDNDHDDSDDDDDDGFIIAETPKEESDVADNSELTQTGNEGDRTGDDEDSDEFIIGERTKIEEVSIAPGTNVKVTQELQNEEEDVEQEYMIESTEPDPKVGAAKEPIEAEPSMSPSGSAVQAQQEVEASVTNPSVVSSGPSTGLSAAALAAIQAAQAQAEAMLLENTAAHAPVFHKEPKKKKKKKDHKDEHKRKKEKKKKKSKETDSE